MHFFPILRSAPWKFWPMTCGVTLSDCNSVSQPAETLRSSTHKWATQSQVGHDSGNEKSSSHGTKPTKARHWGTMTSLCQVHLPSAWCTVRRVRVNVTIHPQFGTCWRHSFAAKPRPRSLQLSMAWASRLGGLLLCQWLWLEVQVYY